MSGKIRNYKTPALFCITLLLISWLIYMINVLHFITLLPYCAVLALLLFLITILVINQHHKMKTLAAQNNIFENQNYWDQLLDKLPEGVLIMDKARVVVYCNEKAQQLFGIQENLKLADDLLDKKESFFSNFDFEEIKQALESGNDYQYEHTLNLNQKLRSYCHHIAALKDKQEQMAGLIWLATDITDLVESRKEAEAANMVKNQFLANISHELRTPLIGIFGALELLEQSTRLAPETENISIIRKCSSQLLEIIDKVLDVSIIGLGITECRPVKTDPRQVINQTVNMVYQFVYHKGLSLDIQIDKNLPDYIFLDQAKVQQVVLNILYNAVKFTSQGGIIIKLNYTADDTGSWIHISITDTGIGIPKKELGQIFAPFTQVDNSSSRPYQGVGLGLYICKELVNLMGGEIWVESEESIGSTFHIKLPVQDYHGNDFIEPVLVKPEQHFGNDNLILGYSPATVLVVDDNEMTRKIVSQMIQNYGFQADTASNGVEAFNMLQNTNYDLILMDMQMPLMDGYQTTRLIRNSEQFCNIPIVAMTANSALESESRCLQSGCDRYISKPFKAEELIEIIKECLNLQESSYSSENEQLISELLPEFIEDLKQSLWDLDLAVKENDISQILSISHSIKGTAGLYGFGEISSLAATIEKAAKDNRRDLISGSLNQLHCSCRNIGACSVRNGPEAVTL